MYVQKRYDAYYYSRLLEKQETLTLLNPDNGCVNTPAQRDFLMQVLGVTHIKSGSCGELSLRGTKWTKQSGDIERAIRHVVRMSASYLTKYADRFAADKDSLGTIIGEQMELPFTGAQQNLNGFDAREGRPTFEDYRNHERDRRQKERRYYPKRRTF